MAELISFGRNPSEKKWLEDFFDKTIRKYEDRL